MILKITDQLMEYMIRHKAIDAQKQEIVDFYRYGVEITISSLLNVVLILVLAGLFGCFPEGLLFLGVFIPIRQFTGGFHAQSYFRCNTMFCLCFISTLLLYKITFASVWWPALLGLLIADLGIVLKYCPIPNENKPIVGKMRILKLKMISAFLFLAYGAVGIILTVQGIQCGVLLVYTLQLIILLAVAALVAQRIRRQGRNSADR